MNNFSTFSGNWVDLIILLIAFFYIVENWERGFILSMVDLIGLVLSFAIAFKVYPYAGSILAVNFSLPRGISNAFGFILVGVFLEIIFSVGMGIFYRKMFSSLFKNQKKDKKIRWAVLINKAFGVIPATFEALLFSAVVLTFFITMPISGAIKKDILASKLGSPLVAQTEFIERQLNKVFGGAVNETLTFLTVNPNPLTGERVNLRFTQKETKVDAQAEREMLRLVNSEREKRGLTILSRSEELTLLARDYARDMFERGYFSHYNSEGLSPFDRIENAGISYSVAGENLALAPNVSLAYRGLMNSSGHRANILSPEFVKVGIGVVDGGIYGQMFVQEFTD